MYSQLPHTELAAPMSLLSRVLRRWVTGLFGLPGYSRTDFQEDSFAGLTVAVLMIPQSIAYSSLAGLPPIHGLFSGFVAMPIYSLFGSSRHLSVAPVAIVSMAVGQTLQTLVPDAQDPVHLQRKLEIMFLLTLSIGLILVVLGMLRVGSAIGRFISSTVLTGFVAAASIAIATSQVPTMLGLTEVKKSSNTLLLMYRIVLGLVTSGRSTIKFPSAVIGILSLIILLIYRKATKQKIKPEEVPLLDVERGSREGEVAASPKSSRKIPGPLVVTVAGIVFVLIAIHVLRCPKESLSLVGPIPVGLPKMFLPSALPSTLDLASVAGPALVIALLVYMESISIAKKYAEEYHYEVNHDEELFALGLANAIPALFQAFPSAGGLSRSAVNVSAGAKSQVSSLVATVILGLTLSPILSPIFPYIPQPALAPIIIVAVLPLCDIPKLKQLIVFAIETPRFGLGDAVVAVVTFSLTLCVGFEAGLIVGSVVSIFWAVSQAVIAGGTGWDAVEEGQWDANSIPDTILDDPVAILVPKGYVVSSSAPINAESPGRFDSGTEVASTSSSPPRAWFTESTPRVWSPSSSPHVMGRYGSFATTASSSSPNLRPTFEDFAGQAAGRSSPTGSQAETIAYSPSPPLPPKVCNDITLRFSGRVLNFATVARFSVEGVRAFKEAVEHGEGRWRSRRVVLDLREVTSVDVSGWLAVKSLVARLRELFLDEEVEVELEDEYVREVVISVKHVAVSAFLGSTVSE
ncbi:sulfate transporter family-domain-containing protein [Cladochytrium replicatum]|nr:sulfate transporter family-domain-containing protein [Cladochytrium replicatum]